MNTNRRHFFTTLGALGLAAGTLPRVNAEDVPAAPATPAEAPASLCDSSCVLQNPTENSMSVTWGVKQPASGWVEWGTSPDKLENRATGSVFGLNPYSDEVISVQISDLQPNTQYYYRAVTVPVDFRGAYQINPGTPVPGEVKSFVTPGPNADSTSFCVINDTHERQSVLESVMGKIRELNPDYVLWNGDLVNHVQNRDTVMNAILRPAGDAFAQEKPLLVARGNHDTRGIWARNLPRYIQPWHQADARFSDLGYNFVVRHGALAIVGLDTGEDKPDFRREWGGLADYEQIIAKEADWLAAALESEAVKTAPFVVGFCHIPLFDPNPNANPGTLETGFSDYKKLAADLWGATLQKHGIQLMICAHVHRHRVDAPTSERCWTQITGGGCTLDRDVTVIHGTVTGGKLHVDVYKMADGSVMNSFDFVPRKLG